MKIDFDPNKSQRNIHERGLLFDSVGELDWQNALIHPDTRKDYPEPRYIALAHLNRRLHVVVFTPIQQGIRVISFRKANSRERKIYENQTFN